MQSQYLKIKSHNGKNIFQIQHPKFSATISEFGGQLLSFTPLEQDDLLWLSRSATLDGSKPIRGGVPICWPWFGPAKGVNEGEPQHGYIRQLPWQINEVVESNEQMTIRISPLLSEQLKQKLGLDVYVIFEFSDQATINIITTNISNSSIEFSQAIHTYFHVNDISKTVINELQDVDFIDQLEQGEIKNQQTPVIIDKAVDRIYLYKQSDISISTEHRDIDIKGIGHDSVVVWSPWITGAKNMSDFDNDGYKNMLCVEMALTQGYQLKPDETYSLSQTFSAS